MNPNTQPAADNPPVQHKQRQCLKRLRRQRDPILVFSPLAWLKLQLFLHAGDTEVGGFGLSSEQDLLYVQDFVSLEQVTSAVTVEFTDDAVADYFDRCVDAGIPPARFARIWMHTHPGSSPDPSSTDEETFARVFGGCDWGIMFIIGRTGKTYARLSFNAGPGGSILLPVQVDWASWPQVLLEELPRLPELFEEWAGEFDRNIHPYQPVVTSSDNLRPSRVTVEDWWQSFRQMSDDRMFDSLDEFEAADMVGAVEVGYDPAD